MNKGAMDSVGLSSALRRHTAVNLLPVAVITNLEHQAAHASGSSSLWPSRRQEAQAGGRHYREHVCGGQTERRRSKEVRVLRREEELTQQW